MPEDQNKIANENGATADPGEEASAPPPAEETVETPVEETAPPPPERAVVTPAEGTTAPPAPGTTAPPAPGTTAPPAPAPTAPPAPATTTATPADVPSDDADSKGGKGPDGGGTDDNGNGGNGNGDRAPGTTPFDRQKVFTWLTVGQYTILSVLGLASMWFLFTALLGENKGPFLYSLSQPEVARGVITFLIAAATVSIAVLLVMAAIMSGSTNLDERFGLGKEVLTLLIGVLGTIVGFYYGSTKDDLPALRLSPVALSSSTPAIGGSFTLDAIIVGGTSPYTYSIKFNPANIIPDVIDEVSVGPIHHEFTIPTDKGAQPEQTMTFTVEINDSKNENLVYNKDAKQKFVLKAASGTAATTPSPTP